MPDPLLTARGISAGYGRQQILFDLDLDLMPGETTVLLGANGSGKSTMLNALAGFVRPWSGTIRLDSTNIAGFPVHRVARQGILLVSQARDLFPDMSVEENLRLGAWARPGPLPHRLERIYASFPRLAERRAQPVRQMSGGEQQMVAIGRALMGEPRVLLLDEPSGGLAPSFVQEIGAILRRLKSDAVSMILVEQNIRFALGVADRLLILRDGRVQERSDLRDSAITEDEIVRQIYL